MDFSQTTMRKKPITKPLYTICHQNQSQEQNNKNEIPKLAPQSVFIREKQKTATNHSERYPFFQQNETQTNKQSTRNQPHYSDDEVCFNQNQQQ